MTKFTLVNEKNATPKYDLKEKLSTLFNSWIYESHLKNYFFLVHEGEAVIEGNLSLDYYDGWVTDDVEWRKSMNVAGEDYIDKNYGIRGVIVIGNLTVIGSIINSQYEDGPFLYVTGNVSAKNFLASGSHIQISGNTTVEGVLYANYNDGSMYVNGDLNCPVVINADHDLGFGNLINNKIHLDFNEDIFEEDEEGNFIIPDELKAELIEEIVKWDDMQDLLSQGKNILKSQK